MPIGFAIFITAVIVSVVVLLIYHYVILGTTGGLVNANAPQGYNYNENIQYINARLGSMFPPSNYNPPDLPVVNDEVYTPYP
jgi:hypothetical protein